MNDVETAEDVIFQTRATDNVVLNQPSKELKDKFFNQDGTTNPSAITSIGKLDKEDPKLIVQGYKPLEVVDNLEARVARVGAFDGLTQGISLDLQTCSGANEFLLNGDKLLSSLEFNRISDFPGATDHSTISGSIKVHLVETSKVPQGVLSLMGMKYSFDAKFVAQDFSLSVDDNLIDAITYRHGLNGISIETEAETVKEAKLDCNCCSCCYRSFQSFGSLCFICSTSQYQWNPQLCCCCYIKCPECFSCCEAKEPPKFHRFLAFSASEEFVVGEVRKNEYKDIIEEVTEETVKLINCPLYCGACCLVYQNPLKFGQSIIDKNPIIYCCPPKIPQDLDKISQGITWDMKERRHDEVNLVLHYISPLDQKNHSCTLSRRPASGEDVDATYNSFRKFVGLLADHRSKRTDHLSGAAKFGIGPHFNSITLAKFTTNEEI